ncbi:MAG: hypothetical protein CJBNEKGG_02184 [Prosthecobacter sp.]|nr:hypothetical protein [Prosthecobacter sp.]
MPSAPARSKTQPSTWEKELHRFIEASGNTTHAFGLGRLIGRMYALLYLHPGPLSLERIATDLEISKASASLTIRQLEQWHAVRHVPVSGDRRHFYEAETAFRVIVRDGLLPGIRKKLSSAGDQIGRTLHAGTPSASDDRRASTPDVQLIRKRLKAAASLHRKLDAVLSSRLLENLL